MSLTIPADKNAMHDPMENGKGETTDGQDS